MENYFPTKASNLRARHLSFFSLPKKTKRERKNLVGTPFWGAISSIFFEVNFLAKYVKISQFLFLACESHWVGRSAKQNKMNFLGKNLKKKAFSLKKKLVLENRNGLFMNH